MNETVEKTATGAILYDPSVVNQISDETFTPDAWPASSAVEGSLHSVGRGDTYIVSDGDRKYVLRHYHRGGCIARLSRDSYLWLGEKRSRPFMEFRLLARLAALRLPVPRPVAARYRRSGLIYSADLITAYVPDIEPLSLRIRRATDEAFWRRIGAGIASFHQAGVYHADLNAHNVQVDVNDEVFMLDFDRGRPRHKGAWQDRTLARLHRSLQKVRRLDRHVRFSEADWRQFRHGYSDAARSA